MVIRYQEACQESHHDYKNETEACIMVSSFINASLGNDLSKGFVLDHIHRQQR